MNDKNFFKIELINERELTIQPAQTILEASLAASVPHYHACGGKARCSTCRVLVAEGVEFLNPPNEAESALAAKMNFPSKVRLACQTRVASGGRIRLHRLIRDEIDLELCMRSGCGSEAKHSLGEELELALFFLDIRNFTPFVESLLPYDAIHILNRFFALARDAIQSKGGRVIEVAGDGLYAVFGMECRLAEAVESAVQAGYHILDEVTLFNDAYLEIYFNHCGGDGIERGSSHLRRYRHRRQWRAQRARLSG